MTEQEKSILIQEIGQRLNFGLRVVFCYDDNKKVEGTVVNLYVVNNKLRIKYDSGYEYFAPLDKVKLMLRPLETMTDDEKKELALNSCELWDDALMKQFENDINESCKCRAMAIANDALWLYKHGFDTNNLIEKGLAVKLNDDKN